MKMLDIFTIATTKKGQKLIWKINDEHKNWFAPKRYYVGYHSTFRKDLDISVHHAIPLSKDISDNDKKLRRYR